MKETIDLKNKIIDKLCEVQGYISKKLLYYQEPIDTDTYIKDMCGDFTRKSNIYTDLDIEK